jgi:DnaJ-class molecular chaperone
MQIEGTLHNTENGWVFRYQENEKTKELPLYPSSFSIIRNTPVSEYYFENAYVKCEIVTIDMFDRSREYANLIGNTIKSNWQQCPICFGSGMYNGKGTFSSTPNCPTCDGKRIIHSDTGKPPVGERNKKEIKKRHNFTLKPSGIKNARLELEKEYNLTGKRRNLSKLIDEFLLNYKYGV